MNRENIKALLYDKYIRPTEQTRGRAIGIEIEMPVVNLAGAATDFDIARGAAEALFDQYGFVRAGIDTEGHCYSATVPLSCALAVGAVFALCSAISPMLLLLLLSGALAGRMYREIPQYLSWFRLGCYILLVIFFAAELESVL